MLQGFLGDRGPPGRAGPSGPTGDTGSSGLKGDVGFPGAPGQIGYTGMHGYQIILTETTTGNEFSDLVCLFKVNQGHGHVNRGSHGGF